MYITSFMFVDISRFFYKRTLQKIPKKTLFRCQDQLKAKIWRLTEGLRSRAFIRVKNLCRFEGVRHNEMPHNVSQRPFQASNK